MKQSNETFKLQTEELALQREELAKQREETARLAEQAERQTKIIGNNELHARRDTFLRVAEIFMSEMNSSLSRFILAIGYRGDDLHDPLWARLSAGNVSAFADWLITFKNNTGEFDEIIMRHRDKWEIQRTNAQDFILRFDYLAEESVKIDPSMVISNAFSGGGNGEARQIMERFLELTEEH